MNFLLASIIGCETHIVTGLLLGDPTNPFGLVRTALAADAATPDDTLDFLMTDHDPGVAKAAERTYMRRMQGL
ncbi:hypothetical protein BSP239C_03894 [Brevibacterium sp. 239c]|nr:hypothetical protein BSP239C_03894 [Brevibacterium sp. 239c]